MRVYLKIGEVQGERGGGREGEGRKEGEEEGREGEGSGGEGSSVVKDLLVQMSSLFIDDYNS